MADAEEVPRSTRTALEMPSASQNPFPHSPDDFDEDSRVSYSKLEEKWILEQDDGSEWEYDDKLKRWIPSLDEADLERQARAYEDTSTTKEDDSSRPQRKRKRGEQNNGSDSKQQKRNGVGNKAERKNTAVYVTSLPLDATVDEVHSVFSKYGLIAEEIDSGQPRIKMYSDDRGSFKGDALVVYFRPESVMLAIDMLDDTDFRIGSKGPTGTMKVVEADSSYKKQDNKGATEGTERTRRSGQHSSDREKIIKKTQKMNSKLADWDDDDPQALQDTDSRWDKVVILRHMFTLDELEEDPAALLDIKEDIRDECSKLGEVTNVVLFDKEAEGVVTVRFGNAQAAQACIRLMHGRHFGGQRVQAYVADGTEKFKKSKEKQTGMDDDEADGEEKRLDDFGKWLEGDKKKTNVVDN